MDAFNPYYIWLAIPPEQQPPNHYDLLGVPLFESNAEVIAYAADQRMGHLRNLATGKHSELSQKLLNEVATAKVCLLKPQNKAAYDAELRAKQNVAIVAPVPHEAPSSTGLPATDLALPPQIVSPASDSRAPEIQIKGAEIHETIAARITTSQSARKKSQHKRSAQQYALVCVFVAFAGLLGVLFYLNRGKVGSDTANNAREQRTELRVEEELKVPQDDEPPQNTAAPQPQLQSTEPPQSIQPEANLTSAIGAVAATDSMNDSATASTGEALPTTTEVDPATPEVEFAKPESMSKIPDQENTTPPKFTNTLGMEFALVPKGKSWLGGGGGKPGNKEVEIANDFYLGVYEVTQEEWETVTGAQQPSHFSRKGAGKDAVKEIPDADLKRFPVENVSWDEAHLFVSRLNARDKQTGWVYRLPNEAEWEYACRGGPLGDKLDSGFDFYFEKPTIQLLPEQANFEHGKGLKRTCKVGSYKPNRLGLYDMIGNVWEWCNDTKSDGSSPPVARGGCYNLNPELCRTATRPLAALVPSHRSDRLGLRLARVPVGTSDPDRRAAEWVLSIGGTISIKENDQERQLGDAGDLPKGPFELTVMNLISNSKVSDAGLAHFEDCKSLTSLHLRNTNVSDAGLARFADCAKLDLVGVKQTKVTEAGVKKLSAALPGCKIEWDGGVIGPTATPPRFTNSLGMEFALVPKGKSWLGGGGGKVGDKEVEFKDDFYLGVYEITQEEWEKVMEKNPACFVRGGRNQDVVTDIADADLRRFPVENVSWIDCQEFIGRLNATTKENDWTYRLPTEAEWEYGCRGGPSTDKADSAFEFYFDKPTNQLLPDQANFKHGINFLKRTSKVGSFPPNRLGLYDMHGNVIEWCADQWSTAGRVYRGGCWGDGAERCRAAFRFGNGQPATRDNYLGLRVARVPVSADPDRRAAE